MATALEREQIRKSMAYDLMQLFEKAGEGKTYTTQEAVNLIHAYITENARKK